MAWMVRDLIIYFKSSVSICSRTRQIGIHIALFTLGLQECRHEVTGLTPTEMLFGRTLRLPAIFSLDDQVKLFFLAEWAFEKLGHVWKAYMRLPESRLNWPADR
ncbi:hypothetical protein AVEN_76364-1 [Araneus ventricosus]|uniref:Uncharacterized protein n=1 Tax=Araneus ventricosus TaxID=182803 RepID=A0A4Y2KL68_ARAVE|nr:hypothetical protein AVEN_76364-1 [Araneus ventricosus]